MTRISSIVSERAGISEKSIMQIPIDAPLLEVVEVASEIPSYLEGVKGVLGGVIAGKGGSVPENPSFTDLGASIRGIPEGLSWATGYLEDPRTSFQVRGLEFDPIIVCGILARDDQVGDGSFLASVDETLFPSVISFNGIRHIGERVFTGFPGGFNVSLFGLTMYGGRWRWLAIG